MRAHAAVAEHVNMGAKHVLQVLPQAHEIDQAATRLHLDQQVNVARRIRVPAHHRAEHTHIARTVLGGVSQDLLPSGAQPSKVDLSRCGTHACDHVTVAGGLDAPTRA